MSNSKELKKPHGLPNKYLDDLDDDFFYHFSYSRSDCKEKFGDVKVKCLITSPYASPYKMSY